MGIIPGIKKSRTGKNRKGMFFTLSAVMLIMILIMLISIKNPSISKESSLSANSRIRAMDRMILDAETDMQRGLYIATFRALLSFNDYITTNGIFLENVSKSFEDAIFEGKVEGQDSNLMAGSTFSDWSTKLKQKALNLNIELNLSEESAVIYQESPWYVTSELNITMIANDTSGIAFWEKNLSIKSYISIVGFEDPVYAVYTGGKVGNQINMTPFELNYTYQTPDLAWHIDNLDEHLHMGYYSENSDAPSFLMRLNGSFAASPNGIESIIPLDKLTGMGISVYEYSCIDHLYWQNYSTGLHSIAGMPDWLRIDNGHKDKYQVNNGVLLVPYP